MLLPDDQTIVARDRVLAGQLVHVLDDERLLALLRERWPTVNVARVHGDYIRYKPSTSCIIGFRGQTETGDDFSGYSKALPDRVAVFRFPQDATLANLCVLDARDECPALWRELLDADTPSSLDSFRIEPLAYKPERRFVGRLVDSDGSPLAAVKFYSRASFSRSLTNARGARSQGELQIAKRLGKSHRHFAIATRWVNSRPLALRDQVDPPPLSALERVGAALAELHGQATDSVGLLTPAVIIGQLRAMPGLIDAIAPQCAPLANGLVERLAPLLERPSPAVTVHGDFYANQVLIGAKHVTIVDTDELARGPAAFDFGNFIAQWLARIDCANVASDQFDTRVRAMCDAMLAGYHAAGGAHIGENDLNLYTAVGCVKLAARAFRRREPGWAEAIGRILHTAQSHADRVPAASRSAPPQTTRFAVDDPFNARNDRVLSSILSVATDPAHVVPELRDRVPELTDRELRAIRITRHKHNRRCLVEFEFGRAGASAELYTVIGKIRAKGVDASQAAIYQSIYDTAFNDDAPDGILVPRPLGVIPAMHMSLQKKVTGLPASQLLNEFEGPGASSCTRIARAIVKLHRANVAPRKRHTIDDELRILDAALATAAQARPDLSDSIATLSDECVSIADSLRSRTVLCGIHRDFYPDQVLLAGGRTYLLDFDLYCLGDPALDAGNFLAHVIDQSVRTFDGDATRLVAHEQVFAEEFAALHGQSIRPAMDAYTTLSLARLVAISTRMPERHVFTAALLDVARSRVGQGSKISVAHRE